MAKKQAKAKQRQKAVTTAAEREAADVAKGRGEQPQAPAADPRTITPRPIITGALRKIQQGDRESLPDGPFKVAATKLGYYGHIRRHPGDVFTIAGREAFSFAWMEVADPNARESITTANQSIKRQHDEILGARVRGESVTGGLEARDPDDVLGDD